MHVPMNDDLDSTGRPDRIPGGVRMIPVSTPSGEGLIGFLSDVDGSARRARGDRGAFPWSVRGGPRRPC
jgi:hypothetical protein